MSGTEIPAIVRNKYPEIIPIEVKTNESPSLADASSIRLFLNAYPKVARNGFVVSRCRVPRRLDENIEVAPWRNL